MFPVIIVEKEDHMYIRIKRKIKAEILRMKLYRIVKAKQDCLGSNFLENLDRFLDKDTAIFVMRIMLGIRIPCGFSSREKIMHYFITNTYHASTN